MTMSSYSLSAQQASLLHSLFFYAEIESVLINVLEKKVTLTCRYPVVRVSTRQVAAVYRNPLGKMAVIKRIFRSYCP